MKVQEFIDKIKEFNNFDIEVFQYTVDSFYENYKIEDIVINYKDARIDIFLEDQTEKFK